MNVYFDNMQTLPRTCFGVVHTRGALLEETVYYPFGLVMKGISSKAYGRLENKIKYNGKEEQRKEFSDGSGLEWLDYGDRFYDFQLGRWNVRDPESVRYYNLSPYQYAANNPIKYIDINGDVIGNLDDPKVKKLQETLESSAKGKDLWKRMNASTRTIYIMFGSDQSQNSTESKIGWYLSTRRAVGITMSKKSYERDVLGNSSSGSSDALFDEELIFNKRNGMYDKTSAWDNTYILLSDDLLPLEAEAIMEEGTNNKVSAEQASNIALLTAAVEESEHSLQDYIDGSKKTKGADGFFIKPTKRNAGNTLSYKQRKHEQEAKAKTKKAILEFIKSNNIILNKEQMQLINTIIDGE